MRHRGHGLLADIAAAVLHHIAAAGRALAQHMRAGKVGQFAAFGLVLVAEVELQLPVVQFLVAHQLQLGRERPARLAAEAFQRADALVGQQLFHLWRIEGAAARRLGNGEAAALGRTLRAGAAIAAVVFLHHTTAVRAGRGQRGVVARHGVAVVFLGLAHDALGHGGNVLHEGRAAQLAMLDLRQLVFPVAGEFGLAQFLHLQAAQQRHQLEGLGGGDHLAPFAQQVFLGQQAFDDGRARGWRAQAFFLHGLAQLVILDPLAGAFHGAQQRGFAVTGRGLGLEALGFGMFGAHHLARLDRH